QNNSNKTPHSQGSPDLTTNLTQTLTLKFLSEKNKPQQINIEDLQKCLSSVLPCSEIIKEYSYLFTILLQPRYLISNQTLKKSKNSKEEQLGIGENGQVFLCTDIGSLELHAVKVVSDINFDNVNQILYECINQYHLMLCNKNMILNFVNQIFFKVVNSKVDFQIPLELAEFSLYDYIQTNEINEEIYNQFTNILIDFLILLHSNNFAHRDIKPQNILFVKDFGWKLADFGESIKYDISQGMHQIKGTLAFIPQEIRKHSKSNREIQQDLYRNDIYATVCTLVMIKNPQFKSQDLQSFMNENQLDETCSKLINLTKLDELYKLKSEKQSKFQYLGKLINRNDELVYYDVKVIIQLYSRLNKALDNRIIQIIDTELGKLKDNNKSIDYIKVVLQLVQYFPFSTDKFKNINTEFDHYIILKNPYLYFSNIIELCKFYFGRRLHKQLIELLNEIQNNCLDGMFMKLYSLMLYGYLEQAKIQLNLIANKIYSESSQDNSDFLAVYNQLYFVLYNEFPLIKGECTQDRLQNELMKKLNIFQRKDLNEQDIQDYLNMENFKPGGGSLNLLALLHPLQPRFSRYRNQQIFDHILHHIGCDGQQIKENKQLLSEFIKEHLQSNNSHQNDLQLIFQGCVILYQYYDLLYELLDLLVYFQKILVITNPGLHSFEFRVEIQRLIIKYNIDFDYRPQRIDQHMIQDNQFGQSDTILIIIEIDIYNFQLKLIKQQFKQRLMSKFKLTLTQELLTGLKLVKYQEHNNKKLIKFENLLYSCIKQSKPKFQQRFLQGTIAIFQQSDSKEYFIQHFYDLKQYKRIRNSFNFNIDFEYFPQKILLIFAGILLKYDKISKLQKFYPKSIIQLFVKCYNSNQKLFQTYNQHLNAFTIFPRLKKMLPLHNKDLREMYLSKN
ncbi:hypothetical protein pb186bvf_012421, partial [Paramecium bursaria]